MIASPLSPAARQASVALVGASIVRWPTRPIRLFGVKAELSETHSVALSAASCGIRLGPLPRRIANDLAIQLFGTGWQAKASVGTRGRKPIDQPTPTPKVTSWEGGPISLFAP
jgi:hypothetical protein